MRGATPLMHIARRAADVLQLDDEARRLVYRAAGTGDVDVWDEAARAVMAAAVGAGHQLATWRGGGRLFGVLVPAGGEGPAVFSCRPGSTHPLVVMLECVASLADHLDTGGGGVVR